ncbi:hypothetical protein ACHAPT_002025 [Fusarium lateritium]
MAPVRSKKQATEQPLTSPRKLAMAETVPLRAGSPSAYPRSPIKKRTPGAITMQQKQAMIDNMQLEITDRARRLRAQYSFMATTVRSRVEMRINRIPMSMRHVKMGDLLQKYLEQEQQRATRSAALRKAAATRTSPQKQLRPITHATKAATRTKKRMSDAISGDKENEIEHNENAKKRVRGAPNPDMAHHVRPAQILSPTSSNSRLANRSRPASPVKSGIARPASPLKNSGTTRSATATSMLSSMVEKAKATRAGVTRKVTTASTASSSSTSTTAATRTRRAAATTASRAPASRPATRTARRSLANSETSEASSGTVVRKGAAARGAAAKKTAVSSVRKGTTTAAQKKAAAKSTATTGTGRVLRKRA